MKSRVFIRKAAVILFWLILWQAGSILIDNSIIFVGPLDMARALIAQVPSLGSVSYTHLAVYKRQA